MFEQRQLIRELRVIQENIEEIDQEVTVILESSREGQILLSVPAIGKTMAATTSPAVTTDLDGQHAASALHQGCGQIKESLFNVAGPGAGRQAR